MAAIDVTKEAEKAEAEEILKEKLGDPESESKVEDAPIEDIEKAVDHKEWRFVAKYEFEMKGGMKSDIFDRTYIQKPLSYFAMAEFTGLLGRKLAEAMRGPDGLSVDRMTPGEMPLEFSDGRVAIAQGTEGVDAIIQGIAKIASYVPDLIGEAQCIWLRVPRYERPNLLDIWSRPVDEGGLSMDQGEEMLEIFIEQNYDELNNFLKRYARTKETVQKMRKRLTKED